MAEYLKENLSGELDLAKFEHDIAAAGFGATMTDHSYDPVEHWIRTSWSGDLTAGEQTQLDGLIDGAIDLPVKFERDAGSEYFELTIRQGRRWHRHRQRVRFHSPFSGVPTVAIGAHSFDGAADLSIRAITPTSFDFVIQARGRNGGLSVVSFDWEATYV